MFLLQCLVVHENETDHRPGALHHKIRLTPTRLHIGRQAGKHKNSSVKFSYIILMCIYIDRNLYINRRLKFDLAL